MDIHTLFASDALLHLDADALTRYGTALVYLAVVVFALWAVKRNHLLAARRVSALTVVVIATMWTMFYVGVLAHWWSDPAVAAPLSRAFHTFTAVGLSLQVWLIHKSTRIGV